MTMIDENNGHRPEANQLMRREFGGTSISKSTSASMALAAKAKAEVEARFAMAIHRPRNPDQVRASLLRECRRPNFAEVAIYHKPIGDGVEGLSIRFAEAAARCYGNIDTEAAQIYDDDDVRVMRVSAVDLETNVSWHVDVTVSKTVERKFLRKGQNAVAQRTNSYGDVVYVVAASDDDLLNKQGALVSKALRTCILRIIPGNLQDEAYDVCNAILKDKAAKDPDAARNAVCDAFATMNIQPTDIEEWLGHQLAVATPAETEHLRRLFVAIRDGETTWPEALEKREEQLATKDKKKAAKQEKQEPKDAKEPAKGTASVKDQLKKQQGQQTLPQADTAKPDSERE